LRFDRAVAPGGYGWWYIDALSDDGAQGLTLIVFLGSVFSPYYAFARRRAAATGRSVEPLNHAAFNVALYGRRGARWAMTERGTGSIQREQSALCIGPSSLYWNGECLEAELSEVCAPLPRRIRGKLKLWPRGVCTQSFRLGDSGLHRWAPIAPSARIEVELREPALRWQGDAYMDSNFGDEPLELAFESWNWSRGATADGAVVLYDYLPRHAPPRSLALKFDLHGGVTHLTPPPTAALPTTMWRIARATRADAGTRASLRQTLEDGPFYSRSLIDTQLFGAPVAAFHESISLDRFSARWVQCLLPFRMPRAFGSRRSPISR
jgi:carotenoid 1,2-hydratase